MVSLNTNIHKTKLCIDWLLKMLCLGRLQGTYLVFPLGIMVQYSLVQFHWGLYGTQLQWVTRFDVLIFSGSKDHSTHLILSGAFDPLKGSKLKGVLLILKFSDFWACDVESRGSILAEVLKKESNTETPKPESHISTLPFIHLWVISPLLFIAIR